MLSPQRKACPSVGRVRQQSILMVVVLPAPFTPSRAKSSPSPTVRFQAVYCRQFFILFRQPDDLDCIHAFSHSFFCFVSV